MARMMSGTVQNYFEYHLISLFAHNFFLSPLQDIYWRNTCININEQIYNRCLFGTHQWGQFWTVNKSVCETASLQVKEGSDWSQETISQCSLCLNQPCLLYSVYLDFQSTSHTTNRNTSLRGNGKDLFHLLSQKQDVSVCRVGIGSYRDRTKLAFQLVPYYGNLLQRNNCHFW